MRKLCIMFLSLTLAFGLAGTAAAAKKAAKPVVIAKLEENVAEGHVLLKTATATTLATVKANLTIKGAKVTWHADDQTKDNKTYYGVIDKAVIKKEYVFAVGKAFVLAKGVDAKVVWKEAMIGIEALHFLSNPGELLFTTKQALTLAQLKGKIKINKTIASIEAAPEGEGKVWIAKVQNLKPEVEYPIEFLRPLGGGTTTFTWIEYPIAER